MEDAYNKIVAVRDDPSLAAEHKHQLDYAAMLLLHELTIRQEEEDEEDKKPQTYACAVIGKILKGFGIQYKQREPHGEHSMIHDIEFRMDDREFYIETVGFPPRFGFCSFIWFETYDMFQWYISTPQALTSFLTLFKENRHNPELRNIKGVTRQVY